MGESKDLQWKKKSILCVFKKSCFKDNNNPAHWVGHSKWGSLDIDEFFKITPKFDEKEASVTGKTEEEKNTEKKLQTMLIQM